jgi:hypothetical protein
MASVKVIIKHNKLPQLAARFPREVNRIVREQVMQTESDVKVNIRKYGAVDTGNMLNSTQGRMEGEHDGVVSVGADYAVHVNYGTRYISGRPFFSDATERARQEFPERFRGLERGL